MVNKLSNKKIGIITDRDIFRDGRLRKKIHALMESGAEVTVIGFEGTKDRDELAYSLPCKVLLVPRDFVFKQPVFGQSNIWRPLRILVNLTYTKVKLKIFNSLFRPSKMMFFSKSQLACALGQEFDYIEASDVYSLKTAALAAQSKAVPLFFDCYEYFPQYFSDRSIQFQCDRVLKKYLPQVKSAYTISPLVAQENKERFGIDFEVILNSGITEECAVKDVHSPVRLLIQCAFRQVSYDYLMVEAMKHLKNVATLTLQGNFADDLYREKIEKIISVNNLGSSVCLTGDFDSVEATRLANNFDIGIATYLPETLSKDLTLSNRIFTYMNAGLACALPDTKAHRAFSNYDSFGILLDLSSPKTIAQGIQQLIDSPSQIQLMKKNAKKEFAYYRWEDQARKLVNLYAGQ